MPPRRGRASKEAKKTDDNSVTEIGIGIEIKDGVKDDTETDGGANETSQDEKETGGADISMTTSSTNGIDSSVTTETDQTETTKDDTAGGDSSIEQTETTKDDTVGGDSSTEQTKTTKNDTAGGDSTTEEAAGNQKQTESNQTETAKDDVEGKSTTEEAAEDKTQTDDSVEMEPITKDAVDEIDLTLDDVEAGETSKKEEINTSTEEEKKESSEMAETDMKVDPEEVKVVPGSSGVDDDKEEEIPIPETFNKLRQLTVNIGPIKVDDLKSNELHSILRLTSDFEIKFEKKEQEGDAMKKKRQEPPLGSVRIPFEITSPGFFILVHDKLASLKIDGRDMSVKFPEQFNKALNDAKKYMEAVHKRREKTKIAKAEDKKRSVRLTNLPTSADKDTLKSLFPGAIRVVLNKTKQGEFGAHLVFETRLEAKECLKSNKDVTIEDKKVDLSIVVPDNRLSNFKVGSGVGRNRRRASDRSGKPGGVGRGAGPVGRSPAGKGSARGGPAGRGGSTPRGQFGARGLSAGASNPIRERRARLRRQREQLQRKKGGRGGGLGRGGSGSGRGGGRGGGGGIGRGSSPSPARSLLGQFEQEQGFAIMANLMQKQAQALARSSSMNRPGAMSESPMQVLQPLMRQHSSERPSPGGGASRYDRQEDKGGRGGRNRNRRNRRRSEGGPNPASERSSFRPATASAPSEDDPTAMMAYLKNTLARMEEKISQRPQTSNYPRERGQQSHRGDKRKMDYDDYGRESGKRSASYGYSDYEREGRYSYQGDGGGGYGGQSRYGQMDSFGNGSDFDYQSRMRVARGLSDSQSGGYHGFSSGMGSSSQGYSSNQAYYDQWGGRY